MGGKSRLAIWLRMGVLAGAGGFHSSLSDLLLFLDALCANDAPIASMVPPLIATGAQGGMELGWPHPDGVGSRFSIRAPLEALVLSCDVFPSGGVVVLSNAGIDAVVDLGVHVLVSVLRGIGSPGDSR
jgi:serine-type D-Ala-D-Ala carboxypeptidase/endopeptidase